MTGKSTEIALVVTAYFVVSITMVFTNKVLLSSKESGIPAPCFVTWYQCVVTALICWLLGRFRRTEGFFAQFPEQHYDLQTARSILPLSLIFVGMIIFNNLCIQFVEVSFYLIARSLTIVFNVIFTFVLLSTTTSLPVIGTLVVVIFGFYIGSEGEAHFSALGTLFGVTSSVFVSLNSIYTKKILPFAGGNKWTLAFYNNVNASLLFLPGILLLEGRTILDNASVFWSPSFWLAMNIAGVFGFLIGIVTIMQINVTSPLTHNIVGTAKASLQTVLAFFIWKNKATAGSIAGIALVLGGSAIYTYMDQKSGSLPMSASSASPVSRSGEDSDSTKGLLSKAPL